MKKIVYFFSGIFLPALVFAQLPQKIFSNLHFGDKKFSYVSNYPLREMQSAITHAVIVVHGSALNFETYFNTIQILANQNGLEGSLVVISPHYRTNTENPLAPSDELLWTDEGWLSGDGALNSKLSSFEVIDHFMRLLADRKNFPHLKNIVLTGHSAGGQLTQRYAVGTRIEEELGEHRIRYVVANPGSYAYLSPKRLDSKQKVFEVPSNPGCAHNRYKYGLEQLNSYMVGMPAAEMVSKYIAKDVIYMVGTADTIADETFDLSCPAVLQGPYRHLRGIYFKAYMDFEFPGHAHRLVEVPGVGHTQWGMYTSPNGSEAILKNFPP